MNEPTPYCEFLTKSSQVREASTSGVEGWCHQLHSCSNLFPRIVTTRIRIIGVMNRIFSKAPIPLRATCLGSYDTENESGDLTPQVLALEFARRIKGRELPRSLEVSSAEE